MPRAFCGEGLPGMGEVGDIYLDRTPNRIYIKELVGWTFVGRGQEVVGEAEEAWLKRGVMVEHISRIRLLLGEDC